MATVEKIVNKSGETVYKVSVTSGRSRRIKKTWKPNPAWSRRTTERELAKFAAQLENDLAAGQIVTRKEKAALEAQRAAEEAKLLTVKQYGQGVFIPSKRITASEKTVYSYKWTFEKYINPALGDLRLQDVTGAQITAFLLDYQATGAAHSSVVRLYAILNSFFKMAYMDGTVDTNPMDRVQRPTPRKDELQRQGPEAYTEEQLAYILDCLKGEPLKWRAYISLLCETGLRRGECLALQWNNIDFQALEVTVAATLGYTPERGGFTGAPQSQARAAPWTSPPPPLAFCDSLERNRPPLASPLTCSRRTTARNPCTQTAQPAIRALLGGGTGWSIFTPTSSATLLPPSPSPAGPTSSLFLRFSVMQIRPSPCAPTPTPTPKAGNGPPVYSSRH